MQQHWFQHVPEGFAELADVILQVDGSDFPAHSQILASQSRCLQNMLLTVEATSYSRTNKLPIGPEMLAGFNGSDVQAFLCQIYNFSNQPPSSPAEAYQLFRLADKFYSPKLMKVCVDYLAAQPSSLFKRSVRADGVLKWVLLSESYGLEDLQKKAIKFLAENYDALSHDVRLQEMSSASALMLAAALQNIISARGSSLQFDASPSNAYTNIRCTTGYCRKNTCPGHLSVVNGRFAHTTSLHALQQKGVTVDSGGAERICNDADGED